MFDCSVKGVVAVFTCFSIRLRCSPCANNKELIHFMFPVCVCICILWIPSCCLRLHIDFRIYFTFLLSAFDYFPGSRDPGVDGWMDCWLQARSFVQYSALPRKRNKQIAHLLRSSL